ncbi:MAG: hypothetical protein V4773_30305 [Verrucomicrobiota bacterium]
MHHRQFPITPSQPAITGALCIYVEGGKKNDVSQMLFGLSVLRHATEEQIHVAIPSVQESQHLTKVQIQDMLASGHG